MNSIQNHGKTNSSLSFGMRYKKPIPNGFGIPKAMDLQHVYYEEQVERALRQVLHDLSNRKFFNLFLRVFKNQHR